MYITKENYSCSDYRLVSDRNYIILCMTYAAVEIPCVLIKLSKHRPIYSARPTLLTDTLAHVKQRGEGTQREGNSSALTRTTMDVLTALQLTTLPAKLQET